jgi:hypothetical protein
LKKDETVTGETVKNKFNDLMAHGCTRCGSNPIHSGNDVNDGELTVNYVLVACGEGLCALPRAENEVREIGA